MNELPTEGRCTARSFGHSDGWSTFTPTSSLQTEISNLNASVNGSQVTINYDGVSPLFGSHNFNQFSDKRAFFVLYRCAENGSGASWQMVTPQDGDLSGINYDVSDTWNSHQFTHNLDSAESLQGKVWYVGFSMVYSSDNPFLSETNALQEALSYFDSANLNTNPTWSAPQVTSIDLNGGIREGQFAVNDSVTQSVQATQKIGRAHV